MSANSKAARRRSILPGLEAAAKHRGGFDITLLTLVLILLALGLLMVLSSSYPRAYSEALRTESGSPLDYFNHQLVFAVAGLFIMYAASWVPMSLYRQGAKLLYIFTIVMLAAVLVAGTAENNARRWIYLGFFSFQPSEISKLSIILLFADLIAKYRARMNTLKYGVVPYVVVLGNHDCLGTGIETYHKMFGPSNFSFIAGRVKFVCLNTNALEYDFTDPIPDFDFLNTELQADASRYDRTVFCMHAPPLCEQFNNEVLQAFHHYLSLFPGVLFCTAGHLHKNDCFSPLDDGITYYVTDSANHRNYILFTITPNGYEAENIHY
jgi:hypothetical protein